jgi:hypothetical protein
MTPDNAELWNQVRRMCEPLVELITAKKEQFQLAANSPQLDEIYKEDALRQAAKLSESESLFCSGLQIFKQALEVGYPMSEPKLSPDQEKYLPELCSALVN